MNASFTCDGRDDRDGQKWHREDQRSSSNWGIEGEGRPPSWAVMGMEDQNQPFDYADEGRHCTNDEDPGSSRARLSL
jgi:hypothetical protein